MKKICVFINSYNGCTLHRLLLPYYKMKLMTTDYDIYFYILDTKTDTVETIVEKVKDYDYFVFNRSIELNLLARIKEAGVTIICDNDDDWILGKNHPLFMTYQLNNTSEKLRRCMEMADIVTTTTEYLADKIRTVNKAVYVLPNALCSEELFSRYTEPELRLRFGLIGSSSHTDDMKLIEGITKQIKYCNPTLLDKILFVLCGFDEGRNNIYDRATNKLLRVEDVPALNTIWGEWERDLTDNYSIVSDGYREYLTKYVKEDLIPTSEPYVRLWSKDIFEYANLYNCIDVLLVPLLDNEFNRCKSPLKLVEASIKGKAVICSNVAPYSEYLLNGENCIAINKRKGIRGWLEAIEKLTNDRELLSKITDGLSSLTNEDGIFNLDKVTKDRINLFKKFDD